MKTIIYLLLIISFSGGLLVSCNEDDKELFEESAESRIQKQLQEYRDVITSAPNGWYANYIPFQSGPEVKLWFEFNKNGRVSTWSDIPSGTYVNPITKKGVYKKDESNYRVGMHQSPDLIFEDLMVLSNMAVKQNGAFNGEYEFNIISANQDSVVLESSLEAGEKDQTRLTLYAAVETDKEKVSESYQFWEEQMDVFLESFTEYSQENADLDYRNSKYIYGFIQNNTVLFVKPDFETHGIYIGVIGQNSAERFVTQKTVYRSISGLFENGWVLNVPYPFINSSKRNSEVNIIKLGNLIPMEFVPDGANSGYIIL